MRRNILKLLVVLLVGLPFLSLIADQTSAATSRVAVIKELKGTVKVKKAGGSKEFTAFAKMSLNEGDVLSTASNSSAVLQFANGTSEDDKMSVASNTTLTFSKLSNSKGTSTKVSMFNGSAWVDVKSIATKDDEFQLETPTAIMGVRGTHLLVNVDPLSGATRLTVAAGVVSAQTAGSSEAHDVYPTEEALFTSSGTDNSDEITIASADLEYLMQQSEKSIIEAIVKASGEIVKENIEKMDQYIEQSGTLSSTDASRQKSNVESLLGAIVDNAVKDGLITQERVNQLVTEAQKQTGVTIDLSKNTLILSEEEKRQQEEQRNKDLAAKQQAEELKKQAEEERKKNEELLKKLAEDRKQKEEVNTKAQEDKKKEATDSYKNQLSEADKQKFEENQKNNEPAATSSPVSSGSGTTPNNGLILNDLSISYFNPVTYVMSNLDQFQFVAGQDHFEPIEVSTTISKLYISPAVSSGTNVIARLNGSNYPINYSGQIHVPLSDGLNTIVLTLSDATSNHKDYILEVNRRNAPDTLESWTVSTTIGSETPQTRDLIYRFPNEYVYQSNTAVDTFSIDLHYNSSLYPSVTENYISYTEGIPTHSITSLGAGYSKVSLNNLPIGSGILIINLSATEVIRIYILNGVTEPMWDMISFPLEFKDADNTSEVLTTTGPDSSGAYSLHVQGDRIKVTPHMGYTLSMNTNTLVEGPSSANGYSFHLIKPPVASESIISMTVSDSSGYYSHIYSVTVYWDEACTYCSDASLKSFDLRKTSSVGEAVYTNFNSATEQYDVDLGANYFLGYMAATPTVSGATVKYKVDSGSFNNMGSGYQIVDVSSIYTVVQVQVTAVDGVTTKTYEFRLRRPIPNGIKSWNLSDSFNQIEKLNLYATSGGSLLYEAYTATTGYLDMSFEYTFGAPSDYEVKITKLTVASDDKYNVMSGTNFDPLTEWVTDSTGAVQINGIATGNTYYKLQVFYKNGTPEQIGSNHYLVIHNVAP